ncbi:MAG: hypothetical protein IJW45_03495 [Oscillospiraceae bacterium]|nr:hypothetical protein [Oscillospiraceae bacterium]
MMGLFDKIKNALLDKAKQGLLDLVEDKLEDKLGTSRAVPTQSATTPRAQTQGCATPVPAGAPAVDAYAYQGDTVDYFARLLAGCFPQYQICRDYRVPASGAEAAPVTFLLQDGPQPVLAVIVCSKKQFGHKSIEDTVRGCEKQGIPAQCYYKEFRNAAGYVVDRVRKALR